MIAKDTLQILNKLSSWPYRPTDSLAALYDPRPIHSVSQHFLISLSASSAQSFQIPRNPYSSTAESETSKASDLNIQQLLTNNNHGNILV